jgi:Bacterial PH domain
MVAGVAGAVLVAVVVFLWLMLPPSVQDDFDWVQRVTIVAVFVGILVGLYALFRTAARADEVGLTIRNGYRRHHYEWAEIVAISLTPNRPWALIDLADGSTVSVMALQTADGDRAMRFAQELADVITTRSGADHD